VFIPTAFISGLTGQFYRQFALTIAISTLINSLAAGFRGIRIVISVTKSAKRKCAALSAYLRNFARVNPENQITALFSFRL
jgi:hypothetical protein